MKTRIARKPRLEPTQRPWLRPLSPAERTLTWLFWAGAQVPGVVVSAVVVLRSWVCSPG